MLDSLRSNKEREREREVFSVARLRFACLVLRHGEKGAGVWRFHPGPQRKRRHLGRHGGEAKHIVFELICASYENISRKGKRGKNADGVESASDKFLMRENVGPSRSSGRRSLVLKSSLGGICLNFLLWLGRTGTHRGAVHGTKERSLDLLVMLICFKILLPN